MNEEYYILLISKHLSGNCTNSETTELEKWINQSEKNRKIFNSYESDWKNAQLFDDPYEPNSDIASQKFKSTIRRRSNKTISIQRIAAALIILVLASATYFWIEKQSSNKRKHITSSNEVIMHILPDSSKVWLSKNSSISFPEKFENRKIKLNGEAYFEVKTNKEKPFTIHCNNSITEVLGTSFNVQSDPCNQTVKVIVVSGKVSFTSDKKGNIDKVFLNPGDKGMFDLSNQTITSEINDDPNFLAWKDNCLIFDNKKMAEVIKILSNHYNEKIEIESRSIDSCRITSTFNNQELEEILTEIELLLDIEISHENDVTILSENN